MDERKHKTPCPEKNYPGRSKLNGFIQLDPVKPRFNYEDNQGIIQKSTYTQIGNDGMRLFR